MHPLIHPITMGYRPMLGGILDRAFSDFIFAAHIADDSESYLYTRNECFKLSNKNL